MINPTPAIKEIAGFDISRYNELESSKPIIAYYVLVSSLNKCMEARKEGRLTSEEDKRVLITMMDQCEELKTKHSLIKGRDLSDVEAFAIGVFLTAEQDDKNGISDKNTAIKYRCAAYFFDLIKELGFDDYEDKNKFSRFRAAQIAQAIRNNCAVPPHPFAAAVEEKEDSAENFDLPDPSSKRPADYSSDSEDSEDIEYTADAALIDQAKTLLDSVKVALDFKDAKTAAMILKRIYDSLVVDSPQ